MNWWQAILATAATALSIGTICALIEQRRRRYRQRKRERTY